MARSEVKVLIVGDASSLERAMAQATKSADQMGKSLEAQGRKMQSLGTKLSLAVTLPILAFAKVGYNELAESQKAMAQTEAVIRSTGGAAGVTAQHVAKLGSTLQSVSGTSDEVVMQGANLLLTFKGIRNEVGKGNDIFDQATETILDMSIAMGQDMKSSAIQVGKALNDPITGMTALRRVGVQFTDSQQATIEALVETGDLLSAQKLILKELNSEFGGSAEAFGKTVPGQIAKAREAFQDMSGALLVTAAPAIEKIAEVVLKMSLAIQDAPAPVRTLITALAGVAAIGGPVIFVAGSIMRTFDAIPWGKIASGASAVAHGIKALAVNAAHAVGALKAMSAAQLVGYGALGLVIGGLAVLATHLILGRDRYKEIREAAEKWAETHTRNVTAYHGEADALNVLVRSKDVLKAKIAELTEAKDQWWRSTHGVNAELRSANDIGFEYQEQLDLQRAKVEALQPKIDELRQKQHEAKLAEQARVDELGRLAGATEDLTDASDAALDAMAAVQAQILAMSGGQLGYEQSLINAEKAQRDLNEAIEEYGPFSEEARDAGLRVEQAQLSAADAALKLDDATTELTRSIKNTPEAIDAEIAKLEAAKQKHPEVAAAIQTQIDKLIWLKGSIEAVPDHKTTKVDVETAEAEAKLRNFRENLQRALTAQAEAGVALGYQHGGAVPGPPNQAVPAILHGGEYVLSADVVNRIKRGQQSHGAGAAGAVTGIAGGGPTVINLVLDGKVLGRATVDYINGQAKRGPGPLVAAATVT